MHISSMPEVIRKHETLGQGCVDVLDGEPTLAHHLSCLLAMK